MVSVFYQSCSKEEDVKGKIAPTLMLIKLHEEYQEKSLTIYCHIFGWSSA